VRHTYDPARPFEPWVLTIARHCAADQTRLWRQRPWEILVDEQPDAAAESDPGW
jgi:DNA-directed RNA polymerase specialized sigma24 family protein